MRTRRIVVLVAVIAMLLTASASLVQAAPLRGCLKYHQVQPGENLFRIGLQYNITVDVLMAANGISNPNLVYAGQSLCIPDGKVAPPPVPQTGGFYYTIKVGDTLSAIATRYGVSIYAIMRANNIANANFIYAGMIIWIPGSGGTTPGGTTYAQWKGEYFNNVDLSGTPSLVRNDASINFNWGQGWPNPKLAADNFSVRWTRTLLFNAGTFRFTLKMDDGARFFVDNVVVIDQWHSASGATYTADVTLGTGYHTLRLEYYEATGNAFVNLGWVRTTGPTPGATPIPGATATPSATSGGAWTGYYFGNMFLDDLKFSRIDAAINFDWGRGTAGDNMPKDLWSARWVSTQYFASAGVYTFNAIVDDGVRIYVDDNLIVNEWFDHPGTQAKGTASLTAGAHTVKVEYYDRGREAKIQVWWNKQ
ncbi:MAG: PA14 domain-containing protein [Anaerolineae bacterium]